MVEGIGAMNDELQTVFFVVCVVPSMLSEITSDLERLLAVNQACTLQKDEVDSYKSVCPYRN